VLNYYIVSKSIYKLKVNMNSFVDWSSGSQTFSNVWCFSLMNTSANCVAFSFKSGF